MTRDEIEDLGMACGGEGAALLDGFDDAFIGFTLGHEDKQPVAVYNHYKCIASLIRGGIEDRDEAEEYFDYNTMRALIYMGPRHPLIVDTGE